VTRSKGGVRVGRFLTWDYQGGHVSARKNRGGVDEVDQAGVDQQEAESSAPVLDPELDRVPDESDADLVDEGDGAEAGADKGEGAGRSKRPWIVLGSLVALAAAAATVWAAGSLGEPEVQGIPETVGDPVVVLDALNAGGIECTGTAVSGLVATCNATVAVRVFDGVGEAESYVSALVKDPLTSSAIGWVRHGNVVVAAPLTSTPEIADALGAGSQIY
jgi:hypothetical protein